MNEKMNKKPVIVSNGIVKKLNKILLNSNTFKESWLQEILYAEPSILPTNEIDSVYSNLIPIGREISVPSGFIDNFYISSKGYLVVVETKLWRNPESRREVVGQILDYAKDIQQWDYEDLNNIYYKNNDKNLFDVFVEKGYYSKEDEADFIDIVTKNITNARFLLMIVGDGIREGVEKMVSFLNNNPTMQYKFALCELEVYELENGERLVIPNLTLKTNIIERGVLRIVNNNISYEEGVEEQQEKQSSTDKSKYSSSNYLSLDEWIDQKLDNKGYENQIRELIQDIEDSNMFYTIGTSDLQIKLKLPQYIKKMRIFMLFAGGKLVGFQPSEFYNYLEMYNYSKSIADELLEGLKKYLSTNNQKHKPYENIRGYYYIEMKDFLNNKSEILSLIEKFISNL